MGVEVEQDADAVRLAPVEGLVEGHIGLLHEWEVSRLVLRVDTKLMMSKGTTQEANVLQLA